MWLKVPLQQQGKVQIGTIVLWTTVIQTHGESVFLFVNDDCVLICLVLWQATPPLLSALCSPKIPLNPPIRGTLISQCPL